MFNSFKLKKILYDIGYLLRIYADTEPWQTYIPSAFALCPRPLLSPISPPPFLIHDKQPLASVITSRTVDVD